MKKLLVLALLGGASYGIYSWLTTYAKAPLLASTSGQLEQGKCRFDLMESRRFAGEDTEEQVDLCMRSGADCRGHAVSCAVLSSRRRRCRRDNDQNPRSVIGMMNQRV